MTREEQRDMACTNWICSQEKGTVIMARNVWKAAVEWADQHPQWISVEEELPTVGEIVQIYVEDLDDVVYGALQLTGDWWCEEYGCNFSNITYWMRKPKAPRKEDKV